MTFDPFYPGFACFDIFFILFPWMGLLMLFFDIQAKGSDINLGGFKIFMSHHFLNHPDISPVFYQHSCKSVPERVGCDLFFYFSCFPAFADHDGDNCLADRTAKVIHKQITAGPVLFGKPGSYLGYLLSQELHRMLTHGHHTVLVSFAFIDS